jgi:hypothetical protein
MPHPSGEVRVICLRSLTAARRTQFERLASLRTWRFEQFCRIGASITGDTEVPVRLRVTTSLHRSATATVVFPAALLHPRRFRVCSPGNFETTEANWSSVNLSKPVT